MSTDVGNEYGLEEVQKQLLITLDELDKICRENKICYSLHGGTLIGAERNHKLIPWDDDIDVSMSRKNFIKLEQALKKKSYGCSLNKEVLWVPRFTSQKVNNAVCIDILIWDYISENKLEQFMKVNLLRMLQGMMKTDVDYSKYGNGAKVLLKITEMMGKPLSTKQKMKLYYYVSTQCFVGNRMCVHRSNDNFKSLNYILDSDYVRTYSTILLEGKKYMVSRRFQESLVMSYGKDYLTPPPESERVPQHAAIRAAL